MGIKDYWIGVIVGALGSIAGFTFYDVTHPAVCRQVGVSQPITHVDAVNP